MKILWDKKKTDALPFFAFEKNKERLMEPFEMIKSVVMIIIVGGEKREGHGVKEFSIPIRKNKSF
jgi:hypothetical protein